MIGRPVRLNANPESESVLVPGLVVVGVGSGIAASVARKCAIAGYPVDLISGSRASVDPVATAVAALGPRVVTETADAAHRNSS